MATRFMMHEFLPFSIVSSQSEICDTAGQAIVTGIGKRHIVGTRTAFLIRNNNDRSRLYPFISVLPQGFFCIFFDEVIIAPDSR